MRDRPCFGSECSEFCEEYGSCPDSDICVLCGGEGPMNSWYEDREEEEEERRWEEEEGA